MIDVQQLHKSFGSKVAVEQVSFQARDGADHRPARAERRGEDHHLAHAVHLAQTRSRAHCSGWLDSVRQPLQVRRSLGVLPDARGLYKRLTARENIRYFAQLHAMPSELIERRVASLVQTLAMQDIIDRRVEGFSQGERVKTAIARALVHDPRNVLLDEPSNGLDVMSTRSLREFLRQLKAEGRCVLFSTHIMQEVAALCDRIVIIAAGRVVADGTPESLRELAHESSLEEAFVKIIGAATLETLA